IDALLVEGQVGVLLYGCDAGGHDGSSIVRWGSGCRATPEGSMRTAQGAPPGGHIIRRHRARRTCAKPSRPSPASSILTPLTSPRNLRASGPVSKSTVVPSIGLNLQLASAEGLIVPCSTM